MAIDTTVPRPPDLTNRPTPADLQEASEVDVRRREIDGILGEGAWQEALDEWAQYTDCTAADVERAEALGLFRALDFYWDAEADRLRYVVPAVPDEWAEADEDCLDATSLQEELDDLGHLVAETIARDYVDWGEAEAGDLVWGVDTFGQVPTDEGW
jgi:hypothetical protein